MLELLKDDTEVYKQFVQNPSFKRFVTDMVFGLTSGSATPTTDKRHSSRPPPGKHQALEERLARSSDVRDRIGTVLLSLLEKSRRITLGDAIRAAEKLGLGDDDALAAVERLARPQTASLQRFYVDRSGAQARIVSNAEVRERSTKATDRRREWASVIEVVWAANEADAIAGGAA
jgi:type I restriction enzyme R subunit